MAKIKTRYSKQRETIYHFLQNDYSHPTVETVYFHIKKTIPDISLGTVYRNLNLLADQKKIRRLDIGDGCVHYDGQMIPHHHFVCDVCGQIQDIQIDESIVRDFIDETQKTSQDDIKDVDMLFHGKCQHCINKEKEHQH
jgi:Fe2+/Zn2+ uptake regulation proteins